MGPRAEEEHRRKEAQALTDRLLNLDDEKPNPGADLFTLALHIREIKSLLLALGRERYADHG